MTDKEKARQYLQVALNSAAQTSDDYGVNQSGYYEIGTAIKALEKQIPKKRADGWYGKNTECPICHIVASNKYCPNCGQALDFTDHPTEKGGEG